MRVIVDVKAWSREEGVEDLGDGHYFVKMKAPRKKGKANAAVIRLIQKYFDRRAMIVSGHTSNRKIVENQGTTRRMAQRSAIKLASQIHLRRKCHEC